MKPLKLKRVYQIKKKMLRHHSNAHSQRKNVEITQNIFRLDFASIKIKFILININLKM